MERESKNKEMKRKGGLGRGIEALFEDEPQIEETEEEIKELDLGDMRPNPYQPRKSFDDKTLKELSSAVSVLPN